MSNRAPFCENKAVYAPFSERGAEVGLRREQSSPDLATAAGRLKAKRSLCVSWEPAGMEGSEGSRGTRGGLAAPSEEEEEEEEGEGEEERDGGEGARRLLGQEGERTLGLLGLLRIREQIKQHLMEYNTAVNANEESIPDQVIDEKIMECSIEDLERELDDVKISYQNKTLALQRIQVADALRNKLKNEDEDSKFIWDTMKHTIMLSTAILKSHQQSRELEEKLNEVKQSRLALKRAGECKLAQIQDIKRKRKEELENMEVGEMLKKVRRNLQKEIQMTTLIQNIFQNLITGSGVNWAEDPDLKAVVLQLEKNVAGF